MTIRFQIAQALLTVIFTLTGCQSDNGELPSRPANDIEEVPGYLDSTEKEIESSEGVDVTLGSTSIAIPKNSSSANYRVRMSRRNSTPRLEEVESLVLGDAKSDVVDIEMFDPATSKTLASADLLAPYEFKQVFTTAATTKNIGLMIISDSGSPAEQRVLLPNSELAITQSLSLVGGSQITVRVRLKVTAATVWLVSYSEEALKNLNVGTASAISSQGGTATQKVEISANGFADAALLINSNAPYTANSVVTLSLTASNATEMYVSNSADCNSGGNWEAFAQNKAWTISTLNAVARVFVRFRGADGKTSSCVSDSITHDDIPPLAVTAISDGFSSSSLTTSPTFSWSPSASSDLSHYEVAIGSSAGGTDKKTWTNVGNTTSHAMGGLTLSDNTVYFASIRAVDLAGLVSSVTEGDGWSVYTSNLTCPTNYVKIPPNSALSTPEFCVMKYEAKNVGSVATSQPSLAPWTTITRGATENTAGSAWNKCKTLGAGYNLISNLQWQAIARNIEGMASNWSTGTLGTNVDDGNSLNRGHSDGFPYAALAASSDSDPCAGTDNPDCTAANNPSDRSQKRTHTLSSGEIIWDFAGNAYEWTLNDWSTNLGSNDYISQSPWIGGSGTQLTWGPSRSYSSKLSGDRGGLGFAELNSVGTHVVSRGGSYRSSGHSGPFAASLLYIATETLDYIGFRCVYSP